jgi:uncharacterized BrkB/YihY/UPF0761 family membrane protein
MQTKSLWSVTIRAAQDWWEDNCLRLAASLAYYTALSLAPLVLLLVGVTGMVLGREQVAGQLAAQLESLMGSAGRELVIAFSPRRVRREACGRPSSASSPWSSAPRRSSASSRRR